MENKEYRTNGVNPEIEQKISGLIDSYMNSLSEGKDIDQIRMTDQPDKEKIVEVVDKLQRIIFPGFFRNKAYKYLTIRNNLSMQLEDVIYHLTRQIAIVLRYDAERDQKTDQEVEEEARELVFRFLETIPKIREYIDTDVQATLDGDPAAFNKEEVIYTYPGLYATLVYRLAHELYLLKVPLIPRIMTEYAHSRTGIDINPGATIGKYFFMDHGTGIVIGETTVIGEHVKIYQGVTLGALSTSGGRKLRNVKRHPTLEDNVTVYSGASILGGETRIGTGTVIGGNAFITRSIPAGARVTVRSQELHIKTDDEGENCTSCVAIEPDGSWF
ncbi:MAG: serine acetyltransferase [Lachnospiraceae bacterium]|nr:serine acetyltransferase [Lachnospiraceae bacterium]